MRKVVSLGMLLCAASWMLAQTQPASTSASVSASSPSASGAKSGSVSRTTKAVHYRQGGQVKTAFQATELLTSASGEAKVESKKTNVAIDAKFQGMEEATKFGLEYLTYVLWVVSPEGRAVNLGELTLDKSNAHVKTSTDMQTFGLIVTAEPYFAVNQPGNMVVLESVVPENVAQGEVISTKYELVGRGTYSATNEHIQNAIFGIDRTTALELFEARNAVRIAHIAAGQKYASSILAKADQQLTQAESSYRQKQGRPAIESAARETTQTAEDEAQAQAAADNKAAEDREAKARADAEAQSKRRVEAEEAQKQAEAAKAEAERMKAEAEQAAAEASRQKEEAEKAKAEAVAQQQALATETAKAQQAAAQSEQLRQQADQMRQQAEKEKQELRARLLQQLNTILSTRDTARGLIANMSDVLFKTGSFELLPGARERLAKVSGIVLAYPSLHLQIEGHTDSVGGDDYNQQLSEHRAQAVRDYLVQAGINQY